MTRQRPKTSAGASRSGAFAFKRGEPYSPPPSYIDESLVDDWRDGWRRAHRKSRGLSAPKPRTWRGATITEAVVTHLAAGGGLAWRSCLLKQEAGRYVMQSPITGQHSLTVATTDAKRLATHWRRFVETHAARSREIRGLPPKPTPDPEE